MSIRSQFFCLRYCRCIHLGARCGREMAEQSAGRNVMQMKFGAVPGLPTCAKDGAERRSHKGSLDHFRQNAGGMFNPVALAYSK